MVTGLAATENDTVPLDVPLLPEVMLSHGAWLTADH